SSAATIDRWLNWKPESPGGKKPKPFPRDEEPTKPTKAPSVGFVGTSPPSSALSFFRNDTVHSPGPDVENKVLARVRGEETLITSDLVERCFHCSGTLMCDCAHCGRGIISNWKDGQCGCCRGTGFLAWGNVQ